MKLLIAVIGLCLVKKILANDNVLQFHFCGEDYDDNTVYMENGDDFNSIYGSDMVGKNEGLLEMSEMIFETSDDYKIDFTEVPEKLLENKDHIDTLRIKDTLKEFVEKIDVSKSINAKTEIKISHQATEKLLKSEEELTKKDKFHAKSQENTLNIDIYTTKVEKEMRKGPFNENSEKLAHKEDDPNNKEEKKPSYQGESFPQKYLELDPTDITVESLNLYVNRLNRTVNLFLKFLNKTDVNIGLGLYLTVATLKHTIKIYGDKMNKNLTENLKYIIKTADYILSHYLSIHLHGDLKELEYKVAQLFRDDSVIMESLNIEHFKKGLFNKWISSDGSQMHEYVREMDEATLPKEQYVTLVESMARYYVNIDESDECISRIADLPYPIPIAGPMQRCRPDSFCEDAIHSSPSVAYALSHRMLNLMFRRVHRRCYLHSEEFDKKHLDILCSFMYREAVYIARRGYFARDMFLEHIVLCGILGYEEFYRPTWFRKAASWVDDRGCTVEFRNFELNRTKLIVETNNPARIRFARNRLKQTCHDHPMALMMVALSMGIRYALHRLPEIRP